MWNLCSLLVAEPDCFVQGHDGPAYDIKFYGDSEDALLLRFALVLISLSTCTNTLHGTHWGKYFSFVKICIILTKNIWTFSWLIGWVECDHLLFQTVSTMTFASYIIFFLWLSKYIGNFFFFFLINNEISLNKSPRYTWSVHGKGYIKIKNYNDQA